MDEGRDDTGLVNVFCPLCKKPIPVPQIRAFEQQQLVFVRCGSCGAGITKIQISDAYREYAPPREAEGG